MVGHPGSGGIAPLETDISVGDRYLWKIGSKSGAFAGRRSLRPPLGAPSSAQREMLLRGIPSSYGALRRYPGEDPRLENHSEK